jgi:hypothetical protein
MDHSSTVGLFDVISPYYARCPCPGCNAFPSLTRDSIVGAVTRCQLVNLHHMRFGSRAACEYLGLLVTRCHA